MALEAIIFDFDGIILDTETPEFETWRDFYQQNGLDLTIDHWSRRVGGDATDLHFDPISHFEKLTGTALSTELREQQREEYLARCAALTLRPGIIDLIKHAREQKLRLAIASNSLCEWVEKYARQGGVWDYFDCVRARDDVSNGKPAPDLYLSAMECLGVTADRCIAIEDSPTGMQSALNAGLRVVAVLNPLTAPLVRPQNIAMTLNSFLDRNAAELLAAFAGDEP